MAATQLPTEARIAQTSGLRHHQAVARTNICADMGGRERPSRTPCDCSSVAGDDASHLDRGAPTLVGPLLIDGDRALHCLAAEDPPEQVGDQTDDGYQHDQHRLADHLPRLHLVAIADEVHQTDNRQYEKDDRSSTCCPNHAQTSCIAGWNRSRSDGSWRDCAEK
jgi:hypothetical protein